jgi:hypothetical protein
MQNAFRRLLPAVLSLVVLVLAAACSSGGTPANIEFTWLAGAQNDILFDATQLVDGQEITSFHWVFGDGSSQTTTQDTLHHQYAAAGNYTVTLTGTDALDNEYTVTQVVSASP